MLGKIFPLARNKPEKLYSPAIGIFPKHVTKAVLLVAGNSCSLLRFLQRKYSAECSLWIKFDLEVYRATFTVRDHVLFPGRSERNY